jgi:ribosomal protein L32
MRRLRVARRDKRATVEPMTTQLDKCPACGEYGVPVESNRPYKFCLKCKWVEQK